MNHRPVLCVAKSAGVRQMLCLDPAMWSLHIAHSLADAHQAVRSRRFQVGMVCIESADQSAITRFRELIASATYMEWIALVPRDPLLVRDLAQFIVAGFHDYHTLPADPARLMSSLGHVHGLAGLRSEQQPAPSAAGAIQFEMVGKSEKMLTVFRTIRKITNAEAPVLITGESGTGK